MLMIVILQGSLTSFLDDSSAGGLQISADVYEKVILKEGMNQTD